jgi:cyclohexanone monooxygenase
MAMPVEDRTIPKILAALEDTDMEKMEEIRARVDSIVEDHDTAQRLKAWYRQVCKRPCFHDEYLQSFNEANTRLVDTDGQGVERITESGVVACGVEYPVDCVIFASGFEVGTDLASRAGFDLTGRDGVRLSRYWAEGMRTLHGTHVHCFPNAFIVQPTQAANLVSNIPHNIVEAAASIAATVRHTLDHGYREVEVTKEAEERWIALLPGGSGPLMQQTLAQCTPGYYTTTTRATTPAHVPGTTWATRSAPSRTSTTSNSGAGQAPSTA